jgi:hypothetical protein
MITKPAEVLLVQRLRGNAAAAIHRTAFVARKGQRLLLFRLRFACVMCVVTGQDMCGDTNCHWARCYFNKYISLHMQVRMTS